MPIKATAQPPQRRAKGAGFGCFDPSLFPKLAQGGLRRTLARLNAAFDQLDAISRVGEHQDAQSSATAADHNGHSFVSRGR